MIVPMKKITLLVLKTEQRKALKDLRKLGLVHVEEKPANGTLINELKSEKNDLTIAKSLLTEYLPKKREKDFTEPSLLNEEDALKFVYSVLDLTSSYKNNVEELGRLKSELALYKTWGDFSANEFKELSEKGIYLFPASVSEKSYMAMPKTIRTIFLSNIKKTVQFLIWAETGEIPEDLPKDVLPLKMPESSTKELKEKAATLITKIEAYKAEMTKMSAYLNSVEALDKIVTKKLEFETVYDGMSVIHLNEDSENLSDKPLSLVWLTGYVPKEQEKQVTELAKNKSWAYILQEPEEDDPVPTKLKHNKIVGLISPLTDFLGTVPGYNEPDISLWFLLFFGIFFAMIFGDGGYGLLVVIMSAFMILKAKIAKKKIDVSLAMMMYLGIMTVIWGVLTCSWFGAPPKLLPSFLKDIAVYGISSMEEDGIRNKNIMHISFTIGVIHLSIAHLIGIVRNRKSLKLLAEVGSLGMLIGMYFAILSIIISSEKYPITSAVVWCIAIGFVLNFIFANYNGSIGESILQAFGNMISMVLGVVNVFADIMSYIRLWAVGLAGAAISMTVNTMAGPMLGSFIIFIGIILLVFGHGLNCVMNLLSVIVHGVRLNTMEFSTHVGLTWSGFKYMPFSESETA
ncbi:V-type ATP synthase subunit I [Treponema pedis]|uniref:V-type ATP synthase subunit I n=1 Tax=Treponema pedis TaxID=409322 RepID=A0A7S6WRL5_9SPIR|nr:V-type ATP synthase subunit I [Treponema pedis]